MQTKRIAKLSKSAVDATKPEAKDVVVWDTEIKGFALKVTPAGRKSYFLYYRNKEGRQRRPQIGLHGQLTVQQAREIARQWLHEVKQGGDPSDDRSTLRKSATVADLCERFMTEHSEKRNKPGTVYNYRRMIDRFVVPHLGRRKVADIGVADVDKLHAALSATPYQANRVVGMFSKMLNLAERWEWRAPNSNPVRLVDKNKEKGRERYLSKAELARLAEVLADAEAGGHEMPSTVAAIRLLLLTGCRLTEILTLRWEYVDFDAKCLRLPDSKTGAKRVYLNSAALDLLRQLPRDWSGWVIPGGKSGERLVNLQKPWRRLRKQANLDDVRLHDLRHNFASIAAGMGESLQMIGKLLGHSQIQTTMRYAHLAAQPMHDASDRVGGVLSQMMEPRNP